MENKFVDDTVYPPNYSAGGINAYYVGNCETAGNRPAYCICVNKVQAFLRDKRLKDSDCESPVRSGSCPALKMRVEELKEGRAIYFIHRDRLREFNQAIEQSSADKVATVTPQKRKPMIFPAYVTEAQAAARAKNAPVSSSSSGGVLGAIDDTGYASAISAAVEKELSKKVEVPHVEAKQGESLLEMARRVLA